jgi:hypothetical protein
MQPAQRVFPENPVMGMAIWSKKAVIWSQNGRRTGLSVYRKMNIVTI